MCHITRMARTLLVTAATWGMAGALQAVPRPNVVLIYGDDLGFGDMAAYGRHFGTASRIPTPHMDALAAGGMLFTQAHSCSGVCTPSRYGILTGRYSWRLAADGVLPSGIVGLYGNPIIRQGELTLAQFLRDQGYRTACFGKWHLGAQFYDRGGVPFTGNSTTIGSAAAIDLHRVEAHAFHRGFDSFFGVVETINRPPYAYMRDDKVLFNGAIPAAGTHPWQWISEADLATESPAGVGDPNIRQIDYSPTMIAEAVAFINGRAAAPEPFFAYVSLYSPHAPHLPTPAFQGSVGYTYGDFVHQTDHWIGQVVAAIDSHPQLTNTLVILTADNGPETHAYTAGRTFGHDSNGPLRGVKRDSWEGGTRVPFVVRWPAHVATNRVSHALIWQGDIFATVAECLGAPLPAGAAPDAESFLPILLGNPPPANRRDAIVIASIDNQLSLKTTDGWKLVDGTGGGGNATSYDADNVNVANAYGTIGGAPRQLFHLAADLGERTNLVTVLPAKQAELLDRLNEVRAGPAVATALVGHWPFDEPAGQVATNTTGGVPGTLGRGATAGGAGRIGRACALDGTTNGVVTMLGYKGIGGTTARTVSLWVKTTAANTGNGLISWGQDALGKAWDLVLDAGRGRLNINGGNTIGATPLHGGAWRQLTVTFADADGTPNANDVRLYVDGSVETPSSVTAYALATASLLDVVVGLDRSRLKPCSGLVDDVAIWQGALSPAQVRALHGLAAEPALNYDAAAVQRLFDAYAAGAGARVTLGAREWSYATRLTAGADGQLVASTDRYALVMDAAAGTGLSSAGAPPAPSPTIVHIAWDQTGRGDKGSAFFAGSVLDGSELVCRERALDSETALQGAAFFAFNLSSLAPARVNRATFRATLTLTYAVRLNAVANNNMLPVLARLPDTHTWDDAPGSYPLATWVGSTNLGAGLLLRSDHALVYSVLAVAPPIPLRCDVTGDVQAWVNGAAVNNGYVLFATTDVNQGAGFSDLRLELSDAPTLADHWPLDEGHGAKATNVSGSAQGTLGSGVAVDQPGAIGRAYALDGTSNGVVTMVGYKGVFGNGPRTLSLWVQPTTRGGLISWGRDTAANAWELEIDDDDDLGALRCNSGEAFVRDTVDLRGLGWQHVAVTFPGGTHANARLYRNGEALAAIAGGTALGLPVQTIPALDVAIGVERMRAEFISALVDDIAVWSSALKAGELRALHNLGLAPELRYNASQVQALFETHADGPGSAIQVGSVRWRHAGGLTGAADGELRALGHPGEYELILDAAAGTGLSTATGTGSVIIVR